MHHMGMGVPSSAWGVLQMMMMMMTVISASMHLSGGIQGMLRNTTFNCDDDDDKIPSIVITVLISCEIFHL